MALKELTKATVLLSSPKVITFILGLIKAKLNAIYIGTTGVGIVNQLNTVSASLASFSTLSINVGAKKLIIDYNKDINKRIEVPNIIGIFALIVLLLATIFFTTGLFFLDELSEYFLKNQSKGLFLAVYLVFPFITLRTIPRTACTALLEFKTIARTEVAMTVASFVIYLPLIIYFGIQGAVTNILIINILYFIGYYYATFFRLAKRRGVKLISFNKLKIDKTSLKEFTVISSSVTVLGLYSTFSELSIRGIFASELGMDKIGVYTPIIVWSGFFSSFFVPALIQYIFPKYGSCKNNYEIIQVANSGFRMVSFFILPFVLVMIAFNDLLIPIFYSKDFIEASLYLPAHFIGIFFWTWMRILKQIFIPTGRIKQFIPFSLVETTLSLAIVFFLVDDIGLWSWTLRFSLVPFILFVAYLVCISRQINFKIFAKNFFLMVYVLCSSSIVYCIAIYYKEDIVMKCIIVIILLYILSLFISNNERKVLIRKIKQYKDLIKNKLRK